MFLKMRIWQKVARAKGNGWCLSKARLPKERASKRVRPSTLASDIISAGVTCGSATVAGIVLLKSPSVWELSF